MKKEDLSALKNLYQGIFSEDFDTSSVSYNPTVAKTISNGLSIYEDKIKSTKNIQSNEKIILSEETETVSQITSSTPSTRPLKSSGGILGNAEWGTVSTVNDISKLYSSMYEEKKKDHDMDGDNDFDDVRIARMIASGMSKEDAIKKVKEDPKGDEVQEEMKQFNEATRMRKELGKEGEIATRKELAARSKAYNRSGSIDKTIAAAERGADRPYVKFKRNESDEDRKKREERQSRTLRGLASSRRGSVRDKPRAGLRGYAAKVEGDDRDLQSARGSARSAGTLTPSEKKQFGEQLYDKYQGEQNSQIEETIMSEDYQLYEIIASYLLSNGFVEDIENAESMMEAMSSEWVGEIIEDYNEYVEDYNMFVEDLEVAGYDLSEATEEDIEEAFKDIDKKRAVERAADKERAAREIERYSSSRAKGKSKSNRMAPAFGADRRTKAAKRDDGYKGKESDSPEEGYGDMSKYTGDIYAKKFKPGKSVPKVMKFGRPFGKYQPRAIKFSDIKKMGLD